MSSGDDDERAIETQRLVQELAEVRKRMQLRAEQPPLRTGSGAYRAVIAIPQGTPPPASIKQRTSPPPAEPVEAAESAPRVETKPAPAEEEEPPPPTRRRPG